MTLSGDAHGTNTGYATTIAAGAIDVAAGDFILVIVGFRTSNLGISITGVNDGTNTLTGATYNDGTGGPYLAVYSLANAAAVSAAVFTATLGSNLSYRSIDVYILHPGSGETISIDAAVAYAIATSTAAASGAISVSQAAFVFGAAQSHGSDETFSEEKINGAAADAYTRTGVRFDSWYKSLSSADASVASEVTLSASAKWNCLAISIKAVSSGGISIPVVMNHLKMQGVA
jgi:hypothetical protein